MSIIRSNIARQLLAEGGAPRKEFSRGGRGRTDADTMTGSGYTSSFDDGFGGGDEFARPTYSQQYAAINVPDAVSKGGDNEPSLFQKAKNRFKNFETDARMNRINRGLLTDFGAIKSAVGLRNVPPELLGTLADDYTQGGLFSEGLVGGDISLENAASTLKGLEDLGVDLTGDIKSQVADISRSKFAERFGPKKPTTEGGDNETIKKLRAPIAEKKEKPKGEFDDILKFYGAKFAKGGRTDAESQYGADSYGSYSFENDGNRGDGGGPPTVTGGGEEPPMLSGGRGIDVGALQKQGLTPAEIATVFNDYYGLDAGPAVTGPLGPLGTSPSPVMGQVPGGLTGEVTGTTLNQPTKNQPTNLDNLRQAAEDVGRMISDPTSPFGKALDFGKAAVGRGKMYEDVLKADGGVIRQNYGLGSIVKKATRAVKKVAKSPLGKAALIGGLGFLGAKTGFGKNLLADFKKLSAIQQAMTIGGIGLTAAPFFLGQEEEEEKLPTQDQSDPEFRNLLAFYGGPRRFAEGGGDIEDAPMKDMPRQEMASYGYNDAMSDTYDMFLQMKEKQLIPPEMNFREFLQEVVPEMSKKQGIERTMAAEGGMMDLGGNEMDLRGGGFVPLGAKEKADDVPARLSKNEFVMTADAVRAAGGGSVDRGADIMYKTMKTLENKVA